MKLILTHYETSSTIEMIDTANDNVYGNIRYTSRIHNYLSKSHYQTINMQDSTYGDKAAKEVFDYCKINSQYKLSTAT